MSQGDRPVCGCGVPWPEVALQMGAQCINCGESSPEPAPRDPPPPRPSKRELALESALIDLAVHHHNTRRNSMLHDPENQPFWECPCGSCKAVMDALGESASFKKVWRGAR